MKFKTIFIIFNSVILFSFLFIFFMPLFLLGGDYFSIFLAKNWFAAVLFLLTLIIINAYFIGNWKVFSLLEKEEWTELMAFLEERIYQKRILRRSYLKMLINAYLITSNAKKIVNLESHIKEKKPVLLKKFALQFGIPYLLKNEPGESEKYFGRLLAEPGVDNRGWIHWNYAFALMQQKQFTAAKEELLKLLDTNPRPVLYLLTLYMLDSYAGSDIRIRERINQGRTGLQKQYTPEKWRNRIDRSGKNMEIFILSQIIRDASDWLFKPASEEKSHPAGNEIVH